MPGILWNLIVWTAIGILSFTLEILYVVLLKSQQISVPVLLNNLALYLLVFGTIGVIWGSFLILFERSLSKRSLFKKKSAHLGFSMMTAVILIFGGWFNYLYMPELLSIETVAVNLVFIIGVALIFFIVFKILSKFWMSLRTGIIILTIGVIVISIIVIFLNCLKHNILKSCLPTMETSMNQKSSMWF